MRGNVGVSEQGQWDFAVFWPLKVLSLEHRSSQILATTMHPLTTPLLTHHLKSHPNNI